jgi:hypothetical protein
MERQISGPTNAVYASAWVADFELDQTNEPISIKEIEAKWHAASRRRGPYLLAHATTMFSRISSAMLVRSIPDRID